MSSVPLCKYVLKQRIQMVNYQIWSRALTFQKIFCIIPFTKISLKIIKNAFHFILKALFVLKILKFLSSFYGHVEKTAWLEMIPLISKFMTSQPGQQTQLQYTYSQNKDNQTMKLGQLTEYKKRNTFLQEWWRKWNRRD